MKKLILVMGPSGSGKSTYVIKHKKEDDCWYEANTFFITEEGEYEFDKDNIREAHEWCRSNTEKAMRAGKETIYVSNTFIRIWQRKPYIDLARTYGYVIKFVRMNTMYRTIHNVPEDIIQASIDNTQKVTEKELYGLIGVEFEVVD